METLLKVAAEHAPIFKVEASDVTLLDSPDSFYRTILNKIDDAKEKIVWSTLYIGTDDLSKAMVQKLHDRLESRPELQFYLLLDHSRGSREEFNSFSLIRPLVERFGEDRVQVLAYKNHYSKRDSSNLIPYKVREVIGVHHMKFLSFDDCTILTGANLNETYFSDRLDRYMVLENCSSLNTYLFKIFEGLSAFYDKLGSNGAFKASYQSTSALSDMIKSTPIIDKIDDRFVYIVPSLQLGKHQLNQDHQLFHGLLKAYEPLADRKSKISLCTSYFNPDRSLVDGILKSGLSWDILTSAPAASSFYQAKGAIGMIPYMYQRRLDLFRREAQRRQENNVRCFEFCRPRFTFHAKGLLAPLLDNSTWSSIGSSNFGTRSLHRDNELQFYLISANPEFNNRLTKSFEFLFSFGKLMNQATESHSLLTRFASKVFRRYL